MKRFHVHVAVHDLEKSIRFYKAMFDAEPTVRRPDYAKWQLDDPRINFAISQRGAQAGVDHLGIQAENAAELAQLRSQLAQADVAITDQSNATCCYAKSDKHWTIDPQGIAWESFHTLESAPRYGDDRIGDARLPVREAKAACCAPAGT
jgi:catechol 2,3-dioxygenase-like lactoylglutathione lyase family enzyme